MACSTSLTIFWLSELPIFRAAADSNEPMSDSGLSYSTQVVPSFSSSITAILRGVYKQTLGAASETSFAISGLPIAYCTLRCLRPKLPIRRSCSIFFTLESVDIAAQFIMATLLALTRAILEGRNEPALVIRSIELQLRMLGISIEEARTIVERPLPEIAQSFLRP